MIDIEHNKAILDKACDFAKEQAEQGKDLDETSYLEDIDIDASLKASLANVMVIIWLETRLQIVEEELNNYKNK